MTANPRPLEDALAASKLLPGNTTASAPRSGLAKLPLRASATAIWLPHKRRVPEEIDPDLRRTLTGLVRGQLPWPLLLSGPPGTGKTCAGLVLLDHAGGFYFSAEDLAETVAAAEFGRLTYPHSDRLVGAAALWDELASCALVVLDEVGARERVSDHAYKCVKRLLDRREGRPLLVVANVELRTLAALYDDRVASRLAAGTVVRLEGADRRLERYARNP